MHTNAKKSAKKAVPERIYNPMFTFQRDNTKRYVNIAGTPLP